MSYKFYPSPRSDARRIIPPHGSYRQLKSYQMAMLIYDLTVIFCRRFVDKMNKSNTSYKIYSRMSDQMIQAARSGKQNIAEGCMASGTSKKTEMKLVGVARASLEELLQDYEDFLRQRKQTLWDKGNPRARQVRALAYRSNRTYTTYMTYLKKPETAANAMICLVHQANYLLDQQLRSLEKAFLENGGFTEWLYSSRQKHREIDSRCSRQH